MSTVGTARKHSPTRPRAMIPANRPEALRRCRAGPIRSEKDRLGYAQDDLG